MSLYTSRSEFDLEKRVQFTNEIPPYDMFGGLNSVLQTDLWKWILGFTDVEFGLPYSIDTEVEDYNGKRIEKSHDAGIDSGEVYYKMVNGKVVDDVQYGPAPEDNKTFHRLEEYGVVLPEFDFLLHEVYRYLGSMYPDHPDMTELLTDTEFNDMVSNAAAVINYELDVKFFDIVASSLNLKNPKDELLESAMLKLRNLKNDGFRKRVYGSKMGYRMLASDIFQNVSVFPVATYLPIKPVDKMTYMTEVGTTFMKSTDNKIIPISEYNAELNRLQNLANENPTQENKDNLNNYKEKYEPVSPMIDVEQLKDWNRKNGYSYDTDAYNNHIRQHNRIIDTYSKHYNRKFRLVDYDGSNSSYPEPKDLNKYAFGYSLPFNEQTIFEVPACTDTESLISEFELSNEVFTNDYDSSTNYVKNIGTDIPLTKISIEYLKVSGNRITVEQQIAEEIHNIITTLKNIVPYKNLSVYPPLADAVLEDEFFNAVQANGEDTFCKEGASLRDFEYRNFLTYYYSTYVGKGFTKDYLKTIIKQFPVIYNPLIENTLYTTPSNTISFYPHSVDIVNYTGTVVDGNVVINNEYLGNFYIPETGINWDCIDRFSYLAIEDLSDRNTTAVNSTIQVTGFTKGYIDIEIDNLEAIDNAPTFNIEDSQRLDDSNGLVIENEKGELIVLEGKLTVKTSMQSGRYVLKSEHFDIAAIPLEKTDSMMETLYPDYSNVIRQLTATGSQDTHEWTAKDYVNAYVENGFDEQLARNYYSDDDDIYNIAKEEIKKSDKDYPSFLERVKELMKYEEQLATWRKNSANLYEKVTYTVDGETCETEQALVQPGCKVTAILQGSKAVGIKNVPDTITKKIVQEDGTVLEEEVFNESSYQNYIDYLILGKKSGYLPGTISSISLGNLNVITIYGNNGSVQYIPTTAEVGESTITLRSPSSESIKFKYLTAVEDIVNPDKTNIIDETLNTKEIYDRYKQSLSLMDATIKDYTMGKKDIDYLNLRASSIEREVIKIESVIDVSHEGYENVIFFESDAAREMFKSLSVGDIVTGPSIDSDDNDVFITHIGDFEATVNVKLQQSGTFLLSYSVKTNVSPKDITNNLLQYKEDLYHNGLYSVKNPFEHGLWPSQDYPRVSTAILDSLPDISFYKIHNYRTETGNSFTRVLEDTHYEDYTALVEEAGGTPTKYLMPSDIKFNNELFLELNLNKLIYYPTLKSNKNPILMSVKWLDYIEDSLMYSSRSTDNVNVGVNVMLETDTTGYYTLLPDNDYTDPQIRLKFITLNLDGQNMWPERGLNDNDWVTPCYAQIGNGGSGRRNWFKSPDDVTYPAVWGIQVYDDVKDPSTFDEDSDFYKNNGELRNVSLYGQDNTEQLKYINSVKYTDVESPLFEIPLGEYDTVTKYVQETGTRAKNLLSITQASFYSQTFTNIMKYFSEDEGSIKIVGNDFTKNNILISYGLSNQDVFTYAGVWTPAKKEHRDENGEITNFFEIIYPENPINFQYYVVTEDVNLSNIVILDDEGHVTGQETRSFTRADVLFYYKDRWYVKNFQYLGLVGDGFDVVDEANGLVKRVNISPEANKSLNQTGTNNLKGSDAKTYYYTFKERLIQYYLRAANVQSAMYYTNVICNTGFDNTYYTDPYNLETGVKITDVLKDFKGIKKIHKDTILYWIYAGTFEPGENKYPEYWETTRNRNWLDEDERVSNESVTANSYSNFFSVGDRIALANFDPDFSETGKKENEGETGEKDWFIFKINLESILGMSLPISLWRNVESTEYDVILDRCDYVDEDHRCGIEASLSKINSEINLPRGYITEGSYNFNLVIDPHFISTGYLYSDDGMSIIKDKEVQFCTTKGAIYFDSDNDAFYTFSNVMNSEGTLSPEVHKIAIKFNEQKFFKNTLKVPCVYQVKNALVSGEQTVKQTPVLTNIDGLDFSADKLSVGDRLLEVRELSLRSIYSSSLEPIFFSNYFNVNYPVKGITENNELYLSSIPNNPTNDTEKYNFAVDVMNLVPVINEFDEITNTYTPVLATNEREIELGGEYDTPQLSKISITKPLLTDHFDDKNEGSFVNREFEYFKNNVVVRGKINTNNPKAIVAPGMDGSMFRNAIEKISVGDTLVGAYALEPTGNEDKFQIKITMDGTTVDNAKIQYAYFANGQFRAVTKDGVVYFNNDIDVASVTSNIECKKSIIFDNIENTRYSGDVVMVGWTKDLGWYIEINLKDTTSVICTLDILESTDANGNHICNISQAYMSNGSHVYVDYETDAGTQHTMVAHTLGEYNKDYLTPRTLTVSYNGTTEGIQIMSENTEISTDVSGNTVWETKVYNGDNVDYTVKVTIEPAEEFVKAVITDNHSSEQIVETFDGNFKVSETYNIEKIDINGEVLKYVIYETASSETTNGSVIVPEKKESGTYDYHVYDATIYVTEGASIWKEYSYDDSGDKYTYEKSDELLPTLTEDAVITGLGKQYNYEIGGTGGDEDIKILYRDIALSSAKLTQVGNTNIYALDSNYISEPYFVDTTMVVNPGGSKTPISSSLMSRAILKKDNSGKYAVYAKGRSLFIKSPTSLLEKTKAGQEGFNNGYSYSGFLTANSFWKHANAPIFNEKMFLTIRSTLVNDKKSVDELVEMSMMRMLELLGHQVNLAAHQNAGITVDGRAMSIDYDNTLLENIRAVFKVISGYTGTYTTDNIDFANKVTYEKLVSAMDYAKNNKSTVGSRWVKVNGSNTVVSNGDGYPLLIQYSGTKWVFRCYGFRLIDETVTDGLSVIGSSKQTFAELAPSATEIGNYFTTFELPDDAPTPNYEHAYASFAYYYTYYLCGNGENTDIISSSNISDIQFTDSNMLVTDVKGNVNSIGLCYLHNRDDIENPDHWNASTFPRELTCYSIERDVVGKANYKLGSQYLTIPRPEVLTRQNTFKVECSYANEEIILYGGYIYSKAQIENIYDDFFRGDKTDAEYQDWKNGRSSDELQVYNTLLSKSKFQNVGTPVLLYSVDKGMTFNMTTLKSTSGKSLEWEKDTEPNTTFYVSAVVFANNEYKVFVRKASSNENLEYYYYFEQDDEGLFDFAETTGTRDMDEYGDISNAHEFDVDSTTGTNDVDYPSDLSSLTNQLNTVPTGFYRMMFTEGANCFYILSTKAVRFGPDVMVQSKTSGSITVSAALTKEGNSEFDVLLAFNTRTDIPNSLEYINMERAQKYVNEMGNLRVPEVTMVDGPNKANRFYSYRELLNPESLDVESEVYDPFGYPAVIEDTNYAMYEYDELYDAETGETIKVPKLMTNDNGDTIYLCDATGKNYIFVDKETNRHTLGTLEMRGSYAMELFQPAYKPTYDSLEEAEDNPSVRKGDDEFRSRLLLDDSRIISFSYDTDKPYVKISTQNTVLVYDVADYLFSEDDTEEFQKYLQSTTTLLGNQLDDLSQSTKEAAIAKIANITYDTGRVEDGNSIWEPRFVLKEGFVTQEDSATVSEGETSTEKVNVSHKFWFDNLTQTYPLKKKRFLSALAFIPYCFRAGITAYNNLGFDDVEETENSALPNPITGVYLSNYGYGGSRDNTTFWENTVPWLVDPDAFVLGEYLTNSVNEPIYMVDAGGKVLQSYDAEQSKKVGETFDISCKFLGENTEKDLYVYSSSDNVYKHKVKLLQPGIISTYTPVKELTLGTTPFELSLWAYQSYKLVDIDTVEGKPNISFKYYGKTGKNEWKYVPCGGVGYPGSDIDFKYDLDTKRICYIGPNKLSNSFYVSPSGVVDVSELIVTFYVNGQKQEVRYVISFNTSFETTDNGYKYHVIGTSMPSVYFDSFAIYVKTDRYDLIKMPFGDTSAKRFKNYTNDCVLSLTISNYIEGTTEEDDIMYRAESISVLDVSNEIVLSTTYDGQRENAPKTSAGSLRFNMQSSFDAPNNTVKVHVGKVLTINLPVFVSGEVQTVEDYIYKSETEKYWVRKTYIDDQCLNDVEGLNVIYDESTLEVTVKKDNNMKTLGLIENSATLEARLGKFKNDVPSTFTKGGYYFNFTKGSVFNNNINCRLPVEIIKIDPYNELSEDVYVNGVYGKLVCRKPVYNSFQELINDKGFIINRSDKDALYSGNKSATITVDMSNINDRSFSLTELLNIEGFNDGGKHYILMKWLTQSTIKTDISICNDDSEFIEIDLEDKTKFPPDRIWFNPDGYPVPPVVIGNSIFNSENNEQYSGETYKNNNGYSIYRCNEKGHLVGYAMTTDQATINRYDTNADGIPDDVEGYIKNADGTIESVAVEFELDPHSNRLADAQIPNKPNYDTCQDWFKNEFFIKGHESNPYWQVLNITSVFNKNHIWEQRMTVNEYVRSTQEMIMKEVPENDCYLVPKRTIMLSIKNDTCLITPDADPVDKKAGLVSFVLDKPAIKYQTEKQFIKYGITAKNPFYESVIWNGNNISLGGYLDSTYTVCSTKNLADPRDKESEIQEVTEFGLFNKYHQLIAYAVFPPIEYRTSSQHISFTAYVKQGSCVDPSTL